MVPIGSKSHVRYYRPRIYWTAFTSVGGEYTGLTYLSLLAQHKKARLIKSLGRGSYLFVDSLPDWALSGTYLVGSNGMDGLYSVFAGRMLDFVSIRWYTLPQSPCFLVKRYQSQWVSCTD